MQESAPEDLDLKIKLLADIDAAAPEGIVISSSTSGYGMSEMQVACATPRAHDRRAPVQPAVPDPAGRGRRRRRTSPEVVAWTSDFYRHVGKSVITMDREVPGFIANRLQEALWREALHMVAEGEATVEQIDLSITDGPGLRWPVQGPMLTFHLAGGQGGMAHMLDHFGPSLQSPWTRLVAAELTPELRDAVVDGCDREADGRTIDELVAERDAGVIAVLRALGSRVTDPVVWTEPVLDEWIDYNGHLSEPYYVLVLGHATDAVMDHVGLGPEYRARARRLAVHRRGARALPRPGAGPGADLEVRSALIGATGKLLWIWHELRVDGTLAGDRGGPRRARRHGGRALLAVPGGRRARIEAPSCRPALTHLARSVSAGADRITSLHPDKRARQRHLSLGR